MPLKARFRGIILPEWVEAIEDECLFEIVVEALITRVQAVRAEVEIHEPCRQALAAADKTMEAIRFGRVTEERAHKRALDAVRKYSSTLECSKHAHRHGH